MTNRPNTSVLQRMVILRWALPLAFFAIAALYQLIFARWVHDTFGDQLHFIVEILFFGTAGPLVAYLAMTRIIRWLEEKEQIEKLARASERRLASITSASADAIIGLDPGGHIESWNLGAELLFGYSESDLRGHLFTELFGGGEAAEVEFHWLTENIHQIGFVRGHETTCLNAAGVEVIIDLTATHLVDEDGKSFGVSIILRDITERKRREEEIRRLNASLNEQVAERTRELAEKVEELRWANAQLQKLDRMRTEFVSLVSHQIRAPLTNMYGTVEHITANCSTMNSTCSRMVVIMNQQLERLDRLVRDVLNTAHIEAGELVLQPEPVSVPPIIAQVVDQMRARTAGRSIRISDKPGLPMVFADRDRVAEVLANLLDNADKYSPPQAEITIETSANDTEVTLSVCDTGPGLPDSALERIFDKFYRVDNSDSQAAYGYGLGLYICRRLVEAQGGRIWAENLRGGGAIFSFSLPVAP
jgi:PAS domain S-box-containing protein